MNYLSKLKYDKKLSHQYFDLLSGNGRSLKADVYGTDVMAT